MDNLQDHILETLVAAMEYELRERTGCVLDGECQCCGGVRFMHECEDGDGTIPYHPTCCHDSRKALREMKEIMECTG